MATTYQDLRSQAAVRQILDDTDKRRAELVRERDNAIRSGDLDFALQFSKDLRPLHRDYLQGALKAILIRYSRTRQKAQDSKSEWPQYELYKKFQGREFADARFKQWKDSNANEEAQDSAKPFTVEAFSTEFVWDEFTTRMQDEKSFLENLTRVAQPTRTWSLLRACRNELRLLQKDLLEGQLEISNFERDNPPPVDHHAKMAEIMEARVRFIELVRELAEERRIICKSEVT